MADGQVNNANASPVPVQASSGHGSGSTPDANTDRAMVAMREHRNGEQTDPNLPASSIKPHLLPDQSSSRLSEMLMGMSPQKHGFHADFQPNCPSAVPSPLHHLPGPSTPMQPAQYMHPMTGPGRVGPWIPTPTQKSMDIHFLMVGEHLDVVGKTTWDAIESLRKEMHPLISDKSKQLAASLEGHINEVKMQVDFINEKTDRTTEQGHNIHTKLEELSKFVRNEVMGSLKSQQNKIDAIEQSMQEVQKTVQSIQKLLEQKLSDPKGGQQHPAASPFHNASSTSSPFPPANHRSQPSFAGFYGNMAEPGREGQSPVAHMHDPRNNSHAHDTNEGHVGFGNSYGQQWGPRSGYHARRSKEDRPYLNNSPYQFANAGPYGSNYNSGYSEFEVPTTPSQHYGGNQGSSK